MTVSRSWLIRLGEKILTKKQVKLAKALAETDPDSDERYRLMKQVDEYNADTAVNILFLSGHYEAQRAEFEAKGFIVWTPEDGKITVDRDGTVTRG